MCSTSWSRCWEVQSLLMRRDESVQAGRFVGLLLGQIEQGGGLLLTQLELPFHQRGDLVALRRRLCFRRIG